MKLHASLQRLQSYKQRGSNVAVGIDFESLLAVSVKLHVQITYTGLFAALWRRVHPDQTLNWWQYLY